MQQIKCSSVYDVKLHMPSNTPLTEKKFLKILLSKCPALGGARILACNMILNYTTKKISTGLVFTRCGVSTMV
jgi:hypothetical protein